VLPGLTVDSFGDTANAIGSIKSACDCWYAHPLFTQRAGLAHDLISQHSGANAYAFGTALSALANHIGGICGGSSAEQVATSHTSGIVTVMQNKMAVRDRTDLQLKAKTRCLNYMRTNAEMSVTLDKLTSPDPAGTEFGTMLGDRAIFVDFSPKSGCRWYRYLGRPEERRTTLIAKPAGTSRTVVEKFPAAMLAGANQLSTLGKHSHANIRLSH